MTLRDPVYPGRVASYDPGLRVFLNQEVYFFSGKESMRRFLQEPTRYSGPLTDPVSQARFQPTPRSPQVNFKGRTFYFESDATKHQFQATPTAYNLRRES